MPIPKNEFFIAFLAHMPKLSLVATKNRFPAHHLDSTALFVRLVQQNWLRSSAAKRARMSYLAWLSGC